MLSWNSIFTFDAPLVCLQANKCKGEFLSTQEVVVLLCDTEKNPNILSIHACGYLVGIGKRSRIVRHVLGVGQ